MNADAPLTPTPEPDTYLLTHPNARQAFLLRVQPHRPGADTSDLRDAIRLAVPDVSLRGEPQGAGLTGAQVDTLAAVGVLARRAGCRSDAGHTDVPGWWISALPNAEGRIPGRLVLKDPAGEAAAPADVPGRVAEIRARLSAIRDVDFTDDTAGQKHYGFKIDAGNNEWVIWRCTDDNRHADEPAHLAAGGDPADLYCDSHYATVDDEALRDFLLNVKADVAALLDLAERQAAAPAPAEDPACVLTTLHSYHGDLSYPVTLGAVVAVHDLIADVINQDAQSFGSYVSDVTRARFQLAREVDERLHPARRRGQPPIRVTRPAEPDGGGWIGTLQGRVVEITRDERPGGPRSVADTYYRVGELELREALDRAGQGVRTHHWRSPDVPVGAGG